MTYTDMVNLLERMVKQQDAGAGWDLMTTIFFAFCSVYDNSAMGKAGIKRGWQIKAFER